MTPENRYSGAGVRRPLPGNGPVVIFLLQKEAVNTSLPK
jgi:hypothetical protein